MPRLSTSPRVKARIRILLKKILDHVNAGLAAPEYPADTFDYRWIDEETSCPKLVIKTKLPFLAEMIEQESSLPVSKDHIREVLLVLQKKLCILEDNRVKTRGSDTWDFTLKLWHTSTDRNLRRFDLAWTQYKKGSRHSFLSENPLLEALPIHRPQQEKTHPLHNLTLRLDSHFIDAQLILKELLKTLAPASTDAIISVVGPGGIGKTTLVLEAAHRCLANTQQSSASSSLPSFDVIIFVSAQPKEFLGPHLSERWHTDRSLKDIIREILKTVDCAEGAPFNLDKQIEYVNSILRDYKTLLILDNLETVENPNRLLAFIRTLPQTVKVVLTSRTRFGIGKTIELDYLSRESGFSLITHQARKKLVSLEFSQIQEIYRLSGGLPLAMAYSVGYLSVHRHLPNLTRAESDQQPSEIAQYCVEASLEQLHDLSSHKLLMAAALFTGQFSGEAAIYVANLSLSGKTVTSEFSNLYRLSLVNELENSYYAMHGLTQDFVCAKLDQNLPLKQAFQERWVKWYTQLLKPLVDNWLDWQDYTALDAEWNNVRSLVNWCIEADRYEDFQTLWLGLRGYTLYRGYWEERQEWMDKLITMAEKRDDQTALIQAIFYKAQTLAHLDDTDHQGAVLSQLKHVWEQGTSVEADIRFGALSYIVGICLQRNQQSEAEAWLRKSSEVVEASQRSKQTQQCVCLYYSAEIALKRKDYHSAEMGYRQALLLSDSLEWVKQSVYIKGGLATLLLERNELEESEELLRFALKKASIYKDRRAIAKCYFHLALVSKKRGIRQEIEHWVTLAQDAFRKLGMTVAADQMQTWLNE